MGKLLGENNSVGTNHKSTYVHIKKISILCDHDQEFMKKTINKFLKNLAGDIDCMKQNLTQKDWEGIRVLAHKMKSSLELMGIKQIATDMKNIENISASKINLEALPALIKTASEKCDVAILELINMNELLSKNLAQNNTKEMLN